MRRTGAGPGGEQDLDARYPAAVTGQRDRQGEAFLLGLRLRGRRVLVVGRRDGSGPRRVPRLAHRGAADVLLVSPTATPAARRAGRRWAGSNWQRRAYARRGTGAGAWLVIACASRPEVNGGGGGGRAEANRTWCVRADDAGRPATGPGRPAAGTGGRHQRRGC